MSDGNQGAASRRPRRSRRRRKDDPTVRQNSKAAAHSVNVLSWVRTQRMAGHSSKEIVALSHTAEDYPKPGKPLSDGSLAAAFAAIYHLEQAGVWPISSNGAADYLEQKRAADYLGQEKKRAGQRVFQVGQRRAAARRDKDPTAAWDMSYEITKLTSSLIMFDIDRVGLDQEGQDIIDDLLDNLLALQEWQERALGAVQGRLGDQRILEKIAALEAKTVANGCTPEEEASAQLKARILRRKHVARLAG